MAENGGGRGQTRFWARLYLIMSAPWLLLTLSIALCSLAEVVVVSAIVLRHRLHLELVPLLVVLLFMVAPLLAGLRAYAVAKGRSVLPGVHLDAPSRVRRSILQVLVLAYTALVIAIGLFLSALQSRTP